jgi:hypothetical protein
MHNWSVDEKKFKKDNPKKYRLWRISQLINYGLGDEKLDKNEVKDLWSQIKTKIDPNTKVYLEYLLWGIRPSSKSITKTFWNLS